MSEAINNGIELKLRQSILKVVAYFDLFDYPVLREEIVFFLDNQDISASVFTETLHELIMTGCLFRHRDFYSLQDNAELAVHRMEGNNNAELLLPLGKKISRFLFQFPYARGIGISGSLSKNIAKRGDDIDYFIITKANRLWVARTLMHFLKKLSFLGGKQHWYCMNYFIDEESLEIEEKNIFTAMELITLIPVCGNGTMNKFFLRNNWVNSYYPSYKSKTAGYKTCGSDSKLKLALEYLLDNRFGDWLDNFLMKLTSKRWRKKELAGKVNVKGLRMGLKTGKHFAKPNPFFFQHKIVSRYIHNLNENTTKWDGQFT